MSDELIVANGINGLTGHYLLPPTTPGDLASLARQAAADRRTQAWLNSLTERASADHLGLPWDVDPRDPGQAGWAVIVASEESDDIRAGIQPLIDHRRSQLGPEMVKVLDYKPEETWSDWLTRHHVSPGNITPDKVPYYIVLAGSPRQIPFSFQYLLATEYAIGRLDFDEPGDYRHYAESIIAYEAGRAPLRAGDTTFFGTRHQFDRATSLSADHLVRPLWRAAFGADQGATGELREPQRRLLLGESATKIALTEILAGATADERPSILFTATHGLGGWPPGHADQRAKHGALLCQEWPGVGRINPAQYFAASDLPTAANVHGLVAFLFACYGVGTPRRDQFAHRPDEAPPLIADEPFVAALPKSLLAHPSGGALAIVGHVERAWGYSFMARQGAQLIPFQNALGQISAGIPVGHAIRDFSARYAVLSTNLTDVLENISFGKLVPDVKVATLWTERNDAQNYILLGDPAARLRTRSQ